MKRKRYFIVFYDVIEKNTRKRIGGGSSDIWTHNAFPPRLELAKLIPPTIESVCKDANWGDIEVFVTNIIELKKADFYSWSKVC
jgi:hypothetical protein